MSRASDLLTDPRSVELRRTMVDRQLRTFDVTDPDVLQAVLATPREPFLNAESPALVYSDAALEAREGSARRRLLTPMVVARALQAAEIVSGERILDVAGGAGYSAAIAARLGGSVLALEESEGFAARASSVFGELGLSNARSIAGDLTKAPAQGGPFDVILVNGVVAARPDGLLAGLAEGGRLLAIEADADGSVAAARFVLYSRAGDAFGARRLFAATGEPLTAFARAPAFVF